MAKMFRIFMFLLGCATTALLAYLAIAYTYSRHIADYEYRLDGWPEEADFVAPLNWKTDFPGKVRILSIQGGALHGLADLEILKVLEERSGKQIHELFDFVAGASTGAVITSLLLNPDDGGKPRTAEQVIETYRHFATEVLDSPLYHRLLTGNGTLGPMLRNKGRLDVAREVFGDDRFNDLMRPAMFPSFSQKNGGLRQFRNWDNRDGNLYLRSLVTAVTSVPSVFPAVEFIEHADGGGFFGDPVLILNSPGELAYTHARLQTPGATEFVVVSIGTLRQLHLTKSTGVFGGLIDWIAPVVRITVRGEKLVSLDALESHNQFESAIAVKTYKLESVVPSDSGGFNPNPNAIEEIRQSGLEFVKANGKLLDDLIKDLTTGVDASNLETVTETSKQ